MHALLIRGSGNEEKQANHRVLDGTNYGEFARADLPDSPPASRQRVVENLFATCVLVGSLFLLVVVDAVSIVVAEALGTVKR
jgi:hypothetical protein